MRMIVDEDDEAAGPDCLLRLSFAAACQLGALRPQKPLRLIRDGEVGGSGILYLTPTRYTVTHQNDSALR